MGIIWGSTNVLEYQRPEDLGILDRVIGCIENFSCHSRDSPGSDRASLLRRFVEIEADAAEDDDYILCNDAAPDNNQINNCADGRCHLEFHIPYFGTMHIMRQTTTGSNRDVAPSAVSMSDIAPEISLSDTLYMQDEVCTPLRY